MKRILFAPKPDWLDPVRERVDPARFQPVFEEFAQADLSAFDAIVPLRMSDYAPLYGRKPAVPNFLVPSRESVAIADDKLRFNTFLTERGFDALIPPLYEARAPYPFIYKKRRDLAGRHSRVIFDRQEQVAFEREIEPADYFKQHYVPGKNEYTTHFLCVGGEIAFATTVEFDFEPDYFVRGVHFASRSTRKIPSPFVATFARILKAMNYTGTCCFNYKIEDGRLFIFELNPRCGGSLRLDLNAYLSAYLDALDGLARNRAA